MSEFDTVVQYYVNYLFWVSIIVGLIALKGKPFIRKLYNIGYAKILCSFAKQVNKTMGTRKRKLFADMHDAAEKCGNYKVVEIGPGTGANFQFYPKGTLITCVDPKPNFVEYLLEHQHEYPHVTMEKFVAGYAEDLRMIESESVDAVTCTFVLCGVLDLEAALQEVLRILKPGGKFYYMEHVCAGKQSWIYTLQRVVEPVWKIVADNCHLTRDTGSSMERAGFSRVDQEQFMSKIKFPVVRPFLIGKATK